MRLSNKLIEDTISDVAGVDVVPLVMYLKNKKNVSEFKLAEHLEQEINATRNMLYRLLKSNLVTFNRKKDKQKGWYIYYWTFNLKRLRHVYSEVKVKKLERYQQRLDREEAGYFFMCPNACMRVDFEQATGFEFKCPECGELMQEQDNSKLKAQLKKQITELKKSK
jgi:transcription initiation factor TFIIE subunit alpha